MSKKSISFAFCLLAILLISQLSQAQTTMQTWVASPDEVFFSGAKMVPFLKETAKVIDPKTKIGMKMKGYMFEDGRGPITDYTRLNLKKFAIISVATGDFDAFYGKAPRYPYDDYIVSLTMKALDSIHHTFYRAAVPAIISELEKTGATCLKIADVMALAEANPELQNWKPESNILSRLDGKKAGGADQMMWNTFNDNTIVGRVNDELEIVPGDAKGFNSYGKLAKMLNVDAVILLTTLLSYDDDENLTLNSVTMHIYGPNLTPKEDKKYIGANGTGYNEGQLYSEISVWGKGAVIAKPIKKKRQKDGQQNAVADFSGFENIGQRLMKASINWIEINRKAQEEIKKS
jgi:hypothetical protein